VGRVHVECNTRGAQEFGPSGRRGGQKKCHRKLKVDR
jgi:hypothetical protein